MMSEKDKVEVATIVAHLQHNKVNRARCRYETKIVGCDIEEPMLQISMVDYRKLCKLANVYDDLTRRMKDGVLVSWEDDV